MDMSSLQSGLPRPNVDPINVAFKEAALSLTTLYKASQQSRHEGYLDAIDEIYTRFLDGSDTVDVIKMKNWIDERRRRTEPPTSSDSTTSMNVSDDIRDSSFETETITHTPLMESPRRVRISSPTRRHARADNETRDGERDRRDRNGAKRRVIGAVDIVPDFHKRGRFG
ncbi:protein of unknown function [Taphrina deformans PYCC 5710]|uniref:Uncharacterized protein n=1 Tax=Taphrina deformans (strain PYCC 5710 / ATCC 11124 / CBS 356.35 / IMI 108563 / JCM 9778 / NBRC 8474) TaxID=1097556 RepID=R4XAT0_TAPDE|nr:protein of unknown function [Taphrina deformans PYCC 5710]|eukprot:CCG81428.1 protein of unknown function [Taphrina deformans PYCC 5710]